MTTKSYRKGNDYYSLGDNGFQVDLPHLYTEKDLQGGVSLKMPDPLAALYTGIILGQWLSLHGKTTVGVDSDDKFVQESKHKIYLRSNVLDIPEDLEEWRRQLMVELADCGLEFLDDETKVRRR